MQGLNFGSYFYNSYVLDNYDNIFALMSGSAWELIFSGVKFFGASNPYDDEKMEWEMLKKNDPGLDQKGYKAPAVHKAFEVLRAVAEAQHGLRIVELAEKLGYSNSSTHGLVHALLRERALIQGNDPHELFLGPLIADLAFTDWNYVKVGELAQPIINEIRDRSEATVFLGVRVRKRVMITATAEANVSLKISAPVGTTIPLFAGAAGKVLLAQETPEKLRQLVGERGLPRYTSKSTVNIEDYLIELERVRAPNPR
jgi:DNA-binding IclR family transcriptional regulator